MSRLAASGVVITDAGLETPGINDRARCLGCSEITLCFAAREALLIARRIVRFTFASLIVSGAVRSREQRLEASRPA